MEKILLHACCAPCAAYVIQELGRRGFQVTTFFYNPNIYPYEEYLRRKNEIEKYCRKKAVEFIEMEDNHDKWREELYKMYAKPRFLKPAEIWSKIAEEPEGGERCGICYKIRLTAAAEFAAQNNYKIFDSTLSISPHKNFEKIKQIGDELAKKYNLKFYGENWKKRDGFKKSCELSRHEGFYRQNYCGCEFSLPQKRKNTETLN